MRVATIVLGVDPHAMHWSREELITKDDSHYLRFRLRPADEMGHMGNDQTL
jgi:hypothetical protein